MSGCVVTKGEASPLGGLAGGTEVLARCGLLEGYRATLPWQRFDAFAQAYPQVTLSQQLFEIDRDRLTCAGGTAAMDMMLTLIGKHHGPRLAEQVSEQFVCDRIRLADERQHVPLRSRLGARATKSRGCGDADGGQYRRAALDVGTL